MQCLRLICMQQSPGNKCCQKGSDFEVLHCASGRLCVRCAICSQHLIVCDATCSKDNLGCERSMTVTTVSVRVMRRPQGSDTAAVLRLLPSVSQLSKGVPQLSECPKITRLCWPKIPSKHVQPEPTAQLSKCSHITRLCSMQHSKALCLTC
jgi:hypothetical protein